MSILEIRNLSVDYYRSKKTIHALRDVSLTIEQGEFISIVGESACGKSTLAHSIIGLIMPYDGKIISGEVLFEDRNILKNSFEEWRKIRGKDISIVFQDPFSSLNPVLSIKEQLFETVKTHNPSLQINEVKDITRETLNKVMLTDHERIMGSYPHQLSGGQRQRIAIAMAIVNKPKILIADEPTTALDVTIQKEILNLIDKLKNELSLTVIFITHNIPLAKERSSKVAIMYAGKVVEFSDAGSIFSNPLHPYTQALLRSVPKVEYNPSLKHVLNGQPPDLSQLFQGCKFNPRCSKVFDPCYKEEPELRDKNGSKVMCHLY